MPPSPEPTRSRLIDAGARLFAERGIDNVSLREISREAGARNVVALQHHFGDREGLLRAIVDKYLPRIEARRHAILDACAAEAPDVRPLASALVDPLAACLHDGDGGPAFLQIFADLVNRPRPMIEVLGSDDPDVSLNQWARMVDPVLPPGAARVHRRLAALLYTSAELARCARAGSQADAAVVPLAVVDVVAAMLRAPVSPETMRAVDEHDLRRAATAAVRVEVARPM